MSGALEGEVAFITGGGGGIGRAVVDRFVAEGARVAVMDFRPERLEPIAAAHGDRVLTLTGDVASLRDNKAAVEQAVETFGKLDIFVGNAGITDGFRDFVDIGDDIVEDAYTQIFDVNVKGYVMGAKAVIPHLVKSRGCMIFTLSNSSFYPDGGGVLYIASKHADLGIMRQLAHELAPVVRVNGVSPGPTKTDIRMPEAFGNTDAGETQSADGEPANAEDVILGCTPLAHWAEPHEHTGAYVLLASRTEGVLITGEEIKTDLGLGIRGLVRTRGGDGLEERLATAAQR
jgi:NAD(P)-dependent dehydrogenase (short-subunit alcohol dehydrogenase family)